MFDPVAELRVGIKGLAAEERRGWSSLARSDRVLDVLGAAERLEAERVRAVAEWDAAGAWADDGATGPVPWLTHRFQMTRPEAQLLVKTASLYARHPEVAAALDGDEIPVLRVRQLAQAEHKREAAFAACVDAMVQAARRLATLAEFVGFLDDWIDAVDEQEPPDLSRRSVRRRRSGRMTSTEIWGTNEDAELLQTALDLHDTPDPADCPEGPRTKAQRDYDSLFDIIRHYLAGRLDGDAEPAGGADVIVDAHTAAELLAHPDQQLDLETRDPLDQLLAPYRPTPTNHHDHGGCHHDDTEAEQRWCEMASGERATFAFAAVMICTGWTRRVIRDPHTGVVLDLGHRQRLFTRTQRRALVYRDRGCVFPGCSRPAKFCDSHHIQPWEDGGLTDLINGVLLCRRHHTLVHNGWDLTRDPHTGVVSVTSPDGRTFTRHPTTTRHPGHCTFGPAPERQPTRC